MPPALASQLATPYHVDSTGRVVRSDPPPPQGDGANSDGLNWGNGLDEAAVHRSPFAAEFLAAFPRQEAAR